MFSTHSRNKRVIGSRAGSGYAFTAPSANCLAAILQRFQDTLNALHIQSTLRAHSKHIQFVYLNTVRSEVESALAEDRSCDSMSDMTTSTP